MSVTESAAYLKGLFEGKDSDDKKLMSELLSTIADMASTITKLQEEIKELRDYAEELDEDLGDVEELVYDLDDDDEDEDDEDDDDDEYYEVICPSCGETVCFDGSMDPSELVCPACGEKFDAVCDAEDCAQCEGCSAADDAE